MSGKGTSSLSSISKMIRLLSSIIRLIVFDGALSVLFALFVFAVVLHKIHDDYLHPQLQLMLFQTENRQYTDNTYYFRTCDPDDFTATSPDELLIEGHFSTEDSVEHMLTHGASIYPNLLTNETASTLRDWIAAENYRREGWNVIQNNNRYSWGIDMNAHPYLQTFWQELFANDKLRNGLEAIVGPDPAVIEFTAITSSYGAVDQYMHADVIPKASAVKYARSFVPSYSLFIPLQDTTYEMGATHVCPGSHLCSEADEVCEEYGAFAVSGEEGTGRVWSMGSGALLNQQTFHKGMGFTQEGAMDRVVLIATFAPRPNYRNGVETRQIGQGGSYSLLWHQWGHTFSDYLHSDKRMTEPQKTLRSLGIIKGKGWNYLSSLSMRMANEDTEMRTDDLEELLEEGGIWFLPTAWQDMTDEISDISDWHAFCFGTLKKVERELKQYYLMGLGAYISMFSFFVVLQRIFGTGKVAKRSKISITLGFLFRILSVHGAILFLAWSALDTVENSSWGKSIRNRKLYRIPVAEVNNPAPSTIPRKGDILLYSHYSSDYLASWARVIDFAHPGNSLWREITTEYAAPFAVLPENLKEGFCETLVIEVSEDRRFLKQDEERFWFEVDDTDELTKACHRDLTKASDPLLGNLISQIDSLQSETRFGRFRETIMQTKTMPDYIRRWENVLMQKKSKKTQSSIPKPKQSLKLRKFGKAIYSPARAATTATMTFTSLPIRRFTLPQQPFREEPFNGAWLEEGDRVEALYKCDEEENEWFTGIVTAAISSEGTYDIAYDDGDSDEGLSDYCVHRLIN